MPISGQCFNESVGGHQYKMLSYVPDSAIQKRLNGISGALQQRMPNQLGGIALLLFLQVISDVNKGRNTSEEMPQLKSRFGRKDDPFINNITELTPKLQRVTPHSNGLRVQQKILPQRLTHSTDSPTHCPLANNAAGLLYDAIKAGIHFIHRHDPLRFPGAEGAVVPGVSTAAETTTGPDDVKIEKLDFVCIEERDNLSVSDVIRKIADTLEFTITEVKKEYAIYSYYQENHACPDAVELANVEKISKNIDTIINSLTGLHPVLIPLYFVKNILPHILRMFADAMEGVEIKAANIESLNEKILTFSRVMTDYALSNYGGQPILEINKAPKSFSLEKLGIFIKLHGKKWELSQKNNNYYATRHGVSRPVVYMKNKGVWEHLTDDNSVSGIKERDQFFTHCNVRQKRGRNLATFCGLFANPEQQTEISESHSDTVFTPSRPIFTLEEKALIRRLDTGLSTTAANVDPMVFMGSVVVYRVRTNERGLQKFYNAIVMDKILLPARAKKISEQHTHYEVYDRNDHDVVFPVEFSDGHWRFEASTSEHIADNLITLIKPEMYAKNVKSNDLSSPNVLGVKFDRDGNSYLKINDNFIVMHHNKDGIFLEPNEHEKLYLGFKKNQYHFYSADVENGKLALTSEQYFNDHLMNSEKGLSNNKSIKINENWMLLNCNVKSETLKSVERIGSKIDVRFLMKFDNKNRSDFIDLPTIYWGERIKYQEGDTSWQDIMNAYERNQHSITFIPWNERYASAYDFVKSNQEIRDNFLVKIYDNRGVALKADELHFARTQEEKVQLVKRYLQRHGGLLEVTISDLPSLKLGINPRTRERVVYFDIGFTVGAEKIDVVKFNQGLSMVENKAKHVFVTTSDDIALATGDINIEPPEEVTRKRIKRTDSTVHLAPMAFDMWENFS